MKHEERLQEVTKWSWLPGNINNAMKPVSIILATGFLLLNETLKNILNEIQKMNTMQANIVEAKNPEAKKVEKKTETPKDEPKQEKPAKAQKSQAKRSRQRKPLY